jgi:hypothetical protein
MFVNKINVSNYLYCLRATHYLIKFRDFAKSKDTNVSLYPCFCYFLKWEKRFNISLRIWLDWCYKMQSREDIYHLYSMKKGMYVTKLHHLLHFLTSPWSERKKGKEWKICFIHVLLLFFKTKHLRHKKIENSSIYEFKIMGECLLLIFLFVLVRQYNRLHV